MHIWTFWHVIIEQSSENFCLETTQLSQISNVNNKMAIANSVATSHTQKCVRDDSKNSKKPKCQLIRHFHAKNNRIQQ